MEDIRAAAYQRILTNDIVGINFEENETTLYHDRKIQNRFSKTPVRKGSSVESHFSTVVEATKTLRVERDVKIIALANVFRLLYQKARDNSADVPLWWNWNETSMTMRIALSRMQDWAKSARPMDVIQLMRYAMVSYFLLADEGKRDEEKELLDVQLPSVVVNDNKKFYFILSDALRKFRDDRKTLKAPRVVYYYQDEVIDVNGIEVRQQLELPDSASNKDVMDKTYKLKFTQTTPEASEIAYYDRITIEWTEKEKLVEKVKNTWAGPQTVPEDLGTNDIFVYISKGKAKVMPFLEYLTKKKVFQETFLDEENLEKNWETFKKKWNQKTAKDTKDDKKTRIEEEELKLKELEDHLEAIENVYKKSNSDIVDLLKTEKKKIEDANAQLDTDIQRQRDNLEEAKQRDKKELIDFQNKLNSKIEKEKVVVAEDETAAKKVKLAKRTLEDFEEKVRKKESKNEFIQALQKKGEDVPAATIFDWEDNNEPIREFDDDIEELVPINTIKEVEKRLTARIKKLKSAISLKKKDIKKLQKTAKEKKKEKEQLKKDIVTLRGKIANVSSEKNLQERIEAMEKEKVSNKAKLSKLEIQKLNEEVKASEKRRKGIKSPKKAIVDQKLLLLKLKSGAGEPAQGKQPRSEHVRRRRAWILDLLNWSVGLGSVGSVFKSSGPSQYLLGLFKEKYDAARNKNPFGERI